MLKLFLLIFLIAVGYKSKKDKLNSSDNVVEKHVVLNEKKIHTITECVETDTPTNDIVVLNEKTIETPASG